MVLTLGRQCACFPLREIAGNQSEAIAQHQQDKDYDRQANTQGQRLHGAFAFSLIPKEKEKPGKQADDHAKQDDKDDELEHGRLQ